MSTISKAQQRAVGKYMKNNYDDIKVRVPKGERGKIKWDIFSLGYESVNQFIVDAIHEKIEREKK